MVSPAYTISLLALAVLGSYCLHAITHLNGLGDMLNWCTEHRRMPDKITPWPAWLDGPDALLRLPSILLGFFWTLLHNESPSAMLASMPYAGQCIAAWIVVLIQGERNGTKGSIASYTTIYGLLVQTIGFAVIGPLFLLLSLIYSPLSSQPSELAVTSNAYLKALPLAMTLGFVIPTIIICLPYPSVLGLDAKTAAILIWQIFPILVYIDLAVIQWLFSSMSSFKPKSASVQLPLLRKAYAFGLIFAIASHFATFSLSLASVLSPRMFNSISVQQLSPWTLFIPSPYTAKVATAAEGVLNLMQWDYYIGSLAHIIWALAVTAPVRKYGKGMSDFSVGNVYVDVVSRTVVLGPMAAVLTLVWERDEVVLGARHEKVN